MCWSRCVASFQRLVKRTVFQVQIDSQCSVNGCGLEWQCNCSVIYEAGVWSSVGRRSFTRTMRSIVPIVLGNIWWLKGIWCLRDVLGLRNGFSPHGRLRGPRPFMEDKQCLMPMLSGQGFWSSNYSRKYRTRTRDCSCMDLTSGHRTPGQSPIGLYGVLQTGSDWWHWHGREYRLKKI